MLEISTNQGPQYRSQIAGLLFWGHPPKGPPVYANSHVGHVLAPSWHLPGVDWGACGARLLQALLPSVRGRLTQMLKGPSGSLQKLDVPFWSL